MKRKVKDMVISAIIDRFEEGNAILLSEGIGIEICIPVEKMNYTYNKGDIITLTIDEDRITDGLSGEA